MKRSFREEPPMQADPEKQIAELEKQLSERTPPPPPPKRLTAYEVRFYVLNTSRTKRSYREDDVDALLDRIERKLDCPRGSALTATDVRTAALAETRWGQTGYIADEVDALLARAALAIEALRSQ